MSNIKDALKKAEVLLKQNNKTSKRADGINSLIKVMDNNPSVFEDMPTTSELDAALATIDEIFKANVN